jgi:hypothetical protein
MTQDALIEPVDPAGQVENVFIETIIESWRFATVFARAVESLEPEGNSRYTGKLDYFRNRLKQNLANVGFHLVELRVDEPYEAGMAVTPLNLADFQSGDQLVIDQVLEPVVMSDGGVRRMGTVMLRRAK